jgi:hypothetical protein
MWPHTDQLDILKEGRYVAPHRSIGQIKRGKVCGPTQLVGEIMFEAGQTGVKKRNI